MSKKIKITPSYINFIETNTKEGKARLDTTLSDLEQNNSSLFDVMELINVDPFMQTFIAAWQKYEKALRANAKKHRTIGKSHLSPFATKEALSYQEDLFQKLDKAIEVNKEFNLNVPNIIISKPKTN